MFVRFIWKAWVFDFFAITVFLLNFIFYISRHVGEHRVTNSYVFWVWNNLITNVFLHYILVIADFRILLKTVNTILYIVDDKVIHNILSILKLFFFNNYFACLDWYYETNINSKIKSDEYYYGWLIIHRILKKLLRHI